MNGFMKTGVNNWLGGLVNEGMDGLYDPKGENYNFYRKLKN